MGQPQQLPRKPRLPPIRRDQEPILEQKIDHLRRKHGVSTSVLSKDVVGLSPEAIPKLLIRAREPGAPKFPGSAQTYLEIALKCDVSTEWLYDLTDDPTPPKRKR